MFHLPHFNNPLLLQQALTHSSYVNEHPDAGPDNERLEFLGDSVLEFVVRDLLFTRFPTMAEGEMSKRGDRLVDETCLASLAVQLDLPPNLRLGSGAQHERHNPSVQADALEAVIGAYRLDAGFSAVYDYVAAIFGPLVEQAMDLPAIDPVSEFQEYVQAHLSTTPPTYHDRGETGPDHAKVFTVEVWVAGTPYGTGSGRSKKEARKQAAIDALRRLKQ
ncbi:ribonuclease III [Nodosilinea sp. P-1105]|uniref:ribonuclease III n=1 Tax=Nodosilinea sp. P-1105 TaxID=2546229 RepID=UPI001469E63E|nr:ribonuclease III [Nodosilinea sp. P-1105]NMF81955.1 ribonuclease III [Nodosilinea sp. P-1105]